MGVGVATLSGYGCRDSNPSVGNVVKFRLSTVAFFVLRESLQYNRQFILTPKKKRFLTSLDIIGSTNQFSDMKSDRIKSFTNRPKAKEIVSVAPPTSCSICGAERICKTLILGDQNLLSYQAHNLQWLAEPVPFFGGTARRCFVDALHLLRAHACRNVLQNHLRLLCSHDVLHYCNMQRAFSIMF